MSNKSGNSIYDNNTYKLKLREEQLDINKKHIDLNDLEIHKEIIQEEKTITIPVNREELVIEKRTFDQKNQGNFESNKETIRIPISEERVDVSKHKMLLNNVSVYKDQFEETEVISEILKRECLHIETLGDAKVIDKDRF